MAATIDRLGSVFIHVKDLKKSTEWYSKILEQPAPDEDPQGPCHWFDMGEGRGVLLDDNRNNRDDVRPSFMLHTEDVHKAYKLVIDNGGEIIREIERDEMVAFFNFKDPDGNVVMVCEEHFKK
ncbi:VOC family protein [Bacillus sp. SM2101]|uniref:VOC family protein n=1 Tax=Bacillus sp. SM2101 TaxID=2805366 RepID=UPI001BDEEC3D|nr:VOC family protein [Bacillus sp. SM2101]